MLKVILLLLTISGSGMCYAQSLTNRMDSVFTWQAANQLLMGNLLVAEKGNVIFQKSYGYQDIEQAILNNDSSAFALASIAKVFTSTAILQLKEKKQLKLDDAFTIYFPDFPYAGITIRQLLSHTSGLPEYELFDSLAKLNPSRIYTNTDIIPALKVWPPKPLYFKPGTDWRYSSMNFCLLALLIEKLSGMTLQQYFTTYIFFPSGMYQSYTDNLLIARPNKYRTQNYEHKQFSTVLCRVDSFAAEHTMIYNYGGFTGQGSVTSTTSDLLLFDRAFFGNKLLSAASVQEALTPVVFNNGRKAMAIPFKGYGESYYGLGWFIAKDTKLGNIVYHPGGRSGVGTIYVHNVTKDQTIVLLENMGTGEVSASSASALQMLNNKLPIPQKISLARLYAVALYKNGPEKANSILNDLKGDQQHYNLSSSDWIDWAKDFFMAKRQDLAIETLKTGILLFPGESIMNECYADIMRITGNKKEAIIMYKKSISINPKNETAKRKLSLLKGTQ